MDTPMVELMTALASMLDTGKYSDLTVVCGNSRYPVHRALLASRSTFFDGACRNAFQESQSGIIDLSEDDPEAVGHMVKYFYHLDYLNKTLSRRSSQRSSTGRSQQVRSRRVSRKLNFAMIEDPLMATATGISTTMPVTPPAEEVDPTEDAVSLTKRPDSPMAEQFEDEPLDCTSVDEESDVEKAHLVTHARVYAIAEKYGVAGLKALAREKFAQQLQKNVDSSEFPEACQDVYETTIDSDRGLRDIVIQAFRSHPELSLRKDVELVVRDTPSLAFELFRMASGLPVNA